MYSTFITVFKRAHISLYLEQNDVSPHPEASILKIHFNISFQCMPRILYWSCGVLECVLRDGKTAQTLCASDCAQKTYVHSYITGVTGLQLWDQTGS